MQSKAHSKTLRALYSVIISLALAISLAPAASADAYNPLSTQVGAGNLLNYVVEGGSVERNSYLALMPPAVTSADDTRLGKWCTGLDDPICDPANNPVNLKATSIFGPCISETDENCIDSLEISVGNNVERATLIRVTEGLIFPADPRYNYPGSSNISLWKTASGAHPFAVMPRMQLYFRNGSFAVGDFFNDVIPYQETTGDFDQIRINTRPDAKPENRYDFARHGQTCVFEENGICGVAQNFPAETRVKIKMRVSKIVGGWFSGRMKDPVLEVSEYSQKMNLITVDAAPVTVPRMALVVKPSDFSSQEKVWFQNMGQWPSVDGSVASGPQAGFPEDSFPFIDFYRERAKDTAVGVNTFWNYTTTSWGNGSKCLEDKSKVLGIVTTNALAYDGSSPSFVDGSLNYRVSGMHYMPDGTTLVRGTYNLVMRSEVARCLYSFSNAPIQATISIIGGENTSVATSVIGERNGWLSMAAAGFTFSTKTIQVKLSQDKGAPEVVVVAAPKVAVKKTLTCINGKTTKKVSAVSPKCPAGFKVKK